MRQVRFFAAVNLALALGGCWQLSNGAYIDPPRARERAGLVRVDWQRRIADYTEIDWRPVFHGTPAYDARTGWLYAGSVDNGMYALQARDAAIVWRFETLGRVDASPTLDDDIVLFGDADGAMYALDARTGQMRWRFATSAEVIHAPIVHNGAVYFVNANDTVFAVNRSDGQLRWRYRRNPPGGITLSGHAGLTRHGGHLFTGFSDGNVVCLDASDGSVVWEQDTSQDIENIDERNAAHDPIDVDTTPVVIADTVYVASFTAGVYGLDVLAGTRRWRLDNVLRVAGLGTDGRYLFAASSASGLVKIDPFDGSVLWARDLDSTALVGAVHVGANVMAVPMADRGIWLVRASDGVILDGLTPGGGFLGMPAVVGSRLYAESNGGVLYALQLRALPTPRR